MRPLAVLVVLALAAPASAEPRVAVTGDDTAGVMAAVRKALDPHVELVGEVDAPDAVVVVAVTGKPRKAKATVTARDAAGGELASFAVKGKRKKLAKDAAKLAWARLGPALDAAAPPPPPPPPAEVPVAEVQGTAAPIGTGTGTGSGTGTASGTGSAAAAVSDAGADDVDQAAAWLELTVDGRPFFRTLRYRDDLDQQLRPYDLAAPAAGITAQWRPKTRGAARFFAVRAELELALGIEGSRTEDGMELPTSSSEWSAGARAEVPIAGWRWTVDVSYGEHRFSLDDDTMPAELIPDTTYRYVRGALGVTAPVADRLSVVGGAGWRQVLGTGDLASDAWFPRATGNGIDAEAGVTYRAFGAVDLLARAELRRYFFAMNPEPGDALVVGGAVDQYLAFVAGVSISLR